MILRGCQRLERQMKTCSNFDLQAFDLTLQEKILSCWGALPFLLEV